MKARTTRAFWAAYKRLPADRQKIAREAFRLWRHDPFHPSLQFKPIAGSARLVSVRVGLGWRALGNRHNDGVIWFWIGPHHQYDALVKRL